jgi:NAD(P)-dependent dehydrogenase (short-subunit alcohol dehydrogenase family)
MVSVLVTGTNQGIGLGLVKELDKHSDVNHVFATVRDPNNSSANANLNQLVSASSKIHIIKLELTEESAAVFLNTVPLLIE